MQQRFFISSYVAAWRASPFGQIEALPWDVTQSAETIIGNALSSLNDEYHITNRIAVHHTAIIESGATIKGPAIIGQRCFVAAGAYLRGGVYLGDGATVGPCAELKTSFMFPGAKIAHLNFVGDSILGSAVNIEAGAMIANYRNELSDKQIRIFAQGMVLETGVEKFGALIGDDSRVGANAVLAPGAIIEPGTKIGRLQLVDQYPV